VTLILSNNGHNIKPSGYLPRHPCIAHLPHTSISITMRPPTPLLPLLLPLVPLVASQSPSTFWSSAGYPPCSQTCLQQVYTNQACTLSNSCFSSCYTPCLCLVDACLCETSSWLIAVAQCIGKVCGANNVTVAASIADSGCSDQGYKLAVASSALVSYGMAVVATGASNPASVSGPTSMSRPFLESSNSF
jgi:hypothetical protein